MVLIQPRTPASQERIALDPSSPWWAEHRSRYHFASKFVRGKRVLDIACGNGLGFDLLLEGEPLWVAGIDVAEEAVRHASDLAKQKPITILRSDAFAIPLRADSIDVVVSFETIEHLRDPDQFLAEVARVLKTDGLLLLSTPNRLQTSLKEESHPANPFHEREFVPEELQSLLRTHWRNVELLGQRVRLGFGVCPYWDTPAEVADYPHRPLRILWKIVARAPRAVRSRLAESLLHQPLYPSERDFEFSPDAGEWARVLVAIARR